MSNTFRAFYILLRCLSTYKNKYRADITKGHWQWRDVLRRWILSNTFYKFYLKSLFLCSWYKHIRKFFEGADYVSSWHSQVHGSMVTFGGSLLTLSVSEWNYNKLILLHFDILSHSSILTYFSDHLLNGGISKYLVFSMFFFSLWTVYFSLFTFPHSHIWKKCNLCLYVWMSTWMLCF